MIEVDALRQEGYIRLATVLDQQGNLDAAVEAAESIERPIRANHPDLFVLQFEFLLAKLRFDEAEAVARQLARAYPRLTDLKRFLDARLQLSRSTRADEGEQREMAAEAARSLTAVVESNPGYARARYFLAMAHLQAGARDEAEEALAQYIDQQPEDRNAQLLYQSLFATGEEALAEMAASAQVLLDSPATPVGQLLAAAVPLARRLQRTPEDKDIYAQAVALLDRATQVDANDSSPHRLRAQVELWRGDVDAAAAAIERARETGAEESDLYMLQAAEAIARENVSAAAALAERALAADDVVPADVRNWARFLQSQGQIALAVDVLDRASASADAAMQADYAAEKVVLAVRAGEVVQATTFVSADLLATDQAARDRALGALIDFALEEVRTGSPNNAESARSIVAFVLEQSPDMPRARLAEALLGLRERPPQLARAEEAAYAAVETADLAGDAYLILFEVAKRRGQYARALTFAQRAREAGETLAGQLAEADAQLQLGEYGVARALAEQVLEGAPNQPQALEILAQAASVAGLRSVAQEALARLRQVQQTTVDVAALAAWIEGTTGTGADVIANLERAVAENPDDFAAVHALARAYARGGDPRRGAERLEALGENVDDDPQPWTAAGQMYLQVPRDAGLSDASSAFARALFIQDDYAPALRGMIDFQLRSGNPGAASGLLERYLALEPSNAEAWHQLAVLTMLFPGRRDRALDAVNQAIELEERPEFFSTRGQVHAQLGNDADAVADLRRFSAAGGEMTAALDITLAESLAANGEGDAARGFLEDAARKVASDDAESQARIDALRQRLDEESAV